MKRVISPQSLAGGAIRHPWITVMLWVVLLGAAFVSMGNLGNVLSDDNGVTGSSESARAQRLIDSRLHADEAPQEYVIVEAEGALNPEAFEQTVANLAATLRGISGVTAVDSFADGGEGLLTEDGRTALIPVTLSGNVDDAMDTAKPVIAAVEVADQADGYRVTTVGNGSIGLEFEKLASETLERGELIGIAVGLVILVVVFGAVVAAGVPLVLAIAAIVLAMGMTAVVGRVFELSTFVTNIITMIGLAVGIDYSLFIVQRFREELDRGLTRDDAIRTAAATASRAVLVSGIAVVIALSGLLIMPDPTFRAFGIGAILVVIAAVGAALTLLPAVLRLAGRRVNWLTLPIIGRRRNPDSAGGFWGAATRAVTAQPVISVVVAGGLLVGASAFFLSINLGNNGISSFPAESNGRHAFEVLTQRFTSDSVVTTDVVIEAADTNATAINDAIARLEAAAATDGFFGDASRETDEAADLTVVRFAMLGDDASAEAREAVLHLREQYIPGAFADVSATVLVGGGTAMGIDSVAETVHYMPIVFAAVLGFSFLLLMLVFRSVVVPLKAVVMNLLSVGAAYGMIVLVFQKGIGAEWFGFHKMPVIEAWLPLFLFSILFGLSMDYHVFLLSRIKERYDQTGDNRHAVEYGLRSTGSIITGAALIMVSVFGGFALGDLAMFQQMGFGLAVAVIVDATIVRSVLVPASMELLGDLNWYFPKWLEWLPEIHVEGRVATAQPASTAPVALRAAPEAGDA